MGYNEGFLGGDLVPGPELSPSIAQEALGGGLPIDHVRYSLIFHATRGLAICAAHNIDGSTLLPEGTIKRRDRFRLDDKVSRHLQIDNDRGYRNNRWDRGHLARRRSLHWGDRAEAEQADSESYFWTNIAPQHERLHDTAWGPIEDWMLERAESDDHRAAVFTGPVLTPDDPEHRNAPDEEPFQIPAGFWKVMVVPHQGSRTVAAFVVWQRDHDSEHPVTFDPFLEQVRLTTIEYLTRLSFPALRPLDPQRSASAARTPAPAQPREPRPGPLNAILSPSDIVL